MECLCSNYGVSTMGVGGSREKSALSRHGVGLQTAWSRLGVGLGLGFALKRFLSYIG